MSTLQNSPDDLAGPIIRQPCHTCGKETSMNIPQQESQLLNLPTELLLQIIEDPSLDRGSLRSLISTSSKLFHCGLRSYQKTYRQNWWLFIKACFSGNVALLNLCEAHDAVPQDLLVTRKLDSFYDDCYELSTIPSKAIERYTQGIIPFEAAYNTLAWLFKRGYDTQWGAMMVRDNLTCNSGQIGPPDSWNEPQGLLLIEDLDKLDAAMRQESFEVAESRCVENACSCQCVTGSTIDSLSTTAAAVLDEDLPAYGDVDFFATRWRPFCWMPIGPHNLCGLSALMIQCWTALWKTPSREQVHHAVKFIELIRRFGALSPTAVVSRGFNEHLHLDLADDTYFETRDDLFKHNVLATALAMHCPPDLLEMLLTDFQTRAIHDDAADWENRMFRNLLPANNGTDTQDFFSQLLDYLATLHGLAPSQPWLSDGWTASYEREPLDMLKEKVEILRRWNNPALVRKLYWLDRGMPILEAAFDASEYSVSKFEYALQCCREQVDKMFENINDTRVELDLPLPIVDDEYWKIFDVAEE